MRRGMAARCRGPGLEGKSPPGKGGGEEVTRACGHAGVAVVAVVSPSTAPAITGPNAVLSDRDNVVLLTFYDEDGVYLWRCSGTLIAPTIVLTAGHCTYGAAEARVWADQGPYVETPVEEGGYPLSPVADRPPCTGYEGWPCEGQDATGEPLTYPGFAFPGIVPDEEAAFPIRAMSASSYWTRRLKRLPGLRALPSPVHLMCSRLSAQAGCDVHRRRLRASADTSDRRYRGADTARSDYATGEPSQLAHGGLQPSNQCEPWWARGHLFRRLRWPPSFTTQQT